MRAKTMFILLIVVFVAEASQIKTKEIRKVRGDTAVLETGFKEYEKIFWMFGPNNRNMARCTSKTDEVPQCKILDEPLRLQIDRQTGSLIIRNISSELAGVYKLQVFIQNKLKEKKFNVIVTAPLPIPKIDHDCQKSSTCVLRCSVLNVTHVTLSWFSESRLISSTSVCDVNSSITIEVNYQDINSYSCVVNDSISNQTIHLNIQPYSEAGLHPFYIALIVLLLVVVVVLVVAAVVHYRTKYKQSNKANVAYKCSNGVIKEVV